MTGPPWRPAGLFRPQDEEKIWVGVMNRYERRDGCGGFGDF